MNVFPRILYSFSDSEDEEYEVIRRPRQIRKRNNPFLDFDDVDFKRRFRLTKIAIRELLDIIAAPLEPVNYRNQPVSAMNQLLITLAFYATGTFQKWIGDYFKVSDSTVCRVVPKVSSLRAEKRPVYINLPNDRKSLQAIQEGFYAIQGFPGIIGALDCTHIKIRSPGGDNAELYRNRKGFFSINVQAFSDSNLRVMDVVARWPGSTHDMTILNSSALRARLESNLFGNTYILGDNGYGCRKYLLTPLLEPRTPAEIRYNNSHIATRNTVERFFGVIKRFPCLSIGMQLRLQTVLTVIISTFVLHNFCKDIGDDENDNVVLNEEETYLDHVIQQAGNENTSVRTY